MKKSYTERKRSKKTFYTASKIYSDYSDDETHAKIIKTTLLPRVAENPKIISDKDLDLILDKSLDLNSDLNFSLDGDINSSISKLFFINIKNIIFSK